MPSLYEGLDLLLLLQENLLGHAIAMDPVIEQIGFASVSGKCIYISSTRRLVPLLSISPDFKVSSKISEIAKALIEPVRIPGLVSN